MKMYKILSSVALVSLVVPLAIQSPATVNASRYHNRTYRTSACHRSETRRGMNRRIRTERYAKAFYRAVRQPERTKREIKRGEHDWRIVGRLDKNLDIKRVYHDVYRIARHHGHGWRKSAYYGEYAIDMAREYDQY